MDHRNDAWKRITRVTLLSVALITPVGLAAPPEAPTAKTGSDHAAAAANSVVSVGEDTTPATPASPSRHAATRAAAAEATDTGAAPNTKDSDGVENPSDAGAGALRRHRPSSASQGRAGRSSMSSSSWYGDGLIPLAVVLGLIALATMALKRWGGKFRAAVGGGHKNLEIVSRLALSPKQSVCVIRLARQLLVVGVTPDRISSLTVIEDPETVCRLLGGSATSGSASMDFSGLFSRESADYDAPDRDDEDEAELPLPADDRPLRRARTEVAGLLERLQRREGVRPAAAADEDDDRGNTIAVA